MLGLLLLVGCSSDRARPPGLTDGYQDTGAAPGPDGWTPGFDVGSADASFNCSDGKDAGVCACKEIGQKPTSFYVVLDRSGSMNEKDGGSATKWDVITLALLHAKDGVLRRLGSRISVGLALFPGPAKGADTCIAGDEYLPLTPGSPATYDKIVDILRYEPPYGGTPTSATLRSLAPKIKALPKPAFVLLATDGAPNCADTPCPPGRCGYNIEKVTRSGVACDEKLNCCDPSLVPEGGGWKVCVDADATREVIADLATTGVKTFVFGAPGVGPYADDLNALATAGGTAREDAKPGEPLYYAATSVSQDAFVAALGAVAAKVLDSCVITLEEVPDDRGITNVLLDGALVPQDPVDGWSWTSDGRIELHGASCAKVKAGEITNVKVAVGCRTVTK